MVLRQADRRIGNLILKAVRVDEPLLQPAILLALQPLSSEL
jgi:hypothetical protein